jgi:adenylate cyclase
MIAAGWTKGQGGDMIVGMSSVEVSGAELQRRGWCQLSRVGWTSAVCGATVTYAAVGFLIPLVGLGREEWRVGALNGPLIAAYLIVSWLGLNRWWRPRMSRALAWLREGRAPTPAEHRRTLALALHTVKLDAALWGLGAVVFGLLNGIVFSWGLAAVVAVTIWLGGETTCALGYLMLERALRPLTARALAARAPDAALAPGVRMRLAMAWLLGTGVPLIGVLALAVVDAGGWDQDRQTAVGAAILFLAIVASATGFLATALAARAIADPLTDVRRGLERIARGELDVHLSVDDGSEVGQLQAGFNRMADGLRERQRIRELFGRHVGEEVAHAALSRGLRLGGEERFVAALFVDLVGSTGLALALAPGELVHLLNRFFRVVVEVVESSGGLVNKFEGDAALCVFGAPVAREDPAGEALSAARALAARLGRELPEIDFGIGVSAGVAVAGNVGAERRFEYTVVGDPVNEAARLAELAKQRPERVLSSAAALERAAAGERAAWSVTDDAVLRGRLAATRLAHPASAPAASA